MKKALIVVDMQNDFISGSLGSKEAQNIISNAKEIIEQCANDEYDIIFTRDTHYDDYLESEEGKKLPVKHCIVGTEGYEIVEELADYADIIVNKETFGSIKLAEYCKKEDYKVISLLGVCTDICVISNALIIKAQMPNVQVNVYKDCCAGVTPELHQNALNVMKSCQINIL